jgi:general secretion pathway protein H
MEWSDIQFYGAGAKTNTGSKSGKDSGKDRVQRFAGHQLPGNMRLEVLSEAELPGDAPAEFATEQKKQKEENKAMPQFVALSSGEVLPVELALYLLRDGEISRGAFVSYSSLSGLQLRWQEDE